MGARQKLNTIYFAACSIVAGTLGIVLQSWAAFAVARAIGLVLKAYDGGIRLNLQRGRRDRS
jgi:hypothetical protein